MIPFCMLQESTIPWSPKDVAPARQNGCGMVIGMGGGIVFDTAPSLRITEIMVRYKRASVPGLIGRWISAILAVSELRGLTTTSSLSGSLPNLVSTLRARGV